MIALPPGTSTDQAKASFKSGILDFPVPAAPEAAGSPGVIVGCPFVREGKP